MKRTTHTALIVSILMLATVGLFGAAGCGRSDDEGPTDEATVDTAHQTSSSAAVPDSTAGEVVLAMSQTARLSPTQADADPIAASQAIEACALDLYALLAETSGTDNVVFSPASIVTALVMAYAGAAGTTADEMAQTLHIDLPADRVHASFNALDSLLESRNHVEQDQQGKDVGVVVNTANSLWAQLGLTFEPQFLDTLAANYGAGVRLVDYRTAAEEARRAINAWVSDETAGKIPELIAAGGLDALTRLVLVNAVHLDATWASQFDPQATRPGDFHTLAGKTVTAQMMGQSSTFPYTHGDGWQAVELPYLHNELAMLLVVPDAGRFNGIQGALADGLLDTIIAGLSTGPEVQLTMPKFEFRTQSSLSDALRRLGMVSAFASETADFSGMTRAEQLYISEVIHEAFIAVDEEGTEAAAATAIVMRAASAPTETVELSIDRPFLFALRDIHTGALVFFGRVTDPSA